MTGPGLSSGGREGTGCAALAREAAGATGEGAKELTDGLATAADCGAAADETWLAVA